MVEDFVIGRNKLGEIYFPGQTDLAGLNLDELGEQGTVHRETVVVHVQYMV